MAYFEELINLAKKYASPEQQGMVNQIQAAVIRDKDIGSKLRWAQVLEADYLFMGRNSFLSWEPEDVGRSRQLLLLFYKDLAKNGNAEAMRYTACAYLNGYEDFSVERRPTGWSIGGEPKVFEAFRWATRAAEAGDAIASDSILPALTDDIRRNAPFGLRRKT